jgi:hypothetical protein
VRRGLQPSSWYPAFDRLVEFEVGARIRHVL